LIIPPESWLGIRSWKLLRLTTSSLMRLDADCVFVQLRVFAQRQRDAVADAHRSEQRPTLERHADLPAHREHPRSLALPTSTPSNPFHCAACAGRADDAKCTYRSPTAHDDADLASIHVEATLQNGGGRARFELSTSMREGGFI
jgi:hypothetical protein